MELHRRATRGLVWRLQLVAAALLASGLLLGVRLLVALKAICDRVEDFQPAGEFLGDWEAGMAGAALSYRKWCKALMAIGERQAYSSFIRWWHSPCSSETRQGVHHDPQDRYR